MTNEQHSFPDYGDHGDLSGAKRFRKAFRFSVIAVVLLTSIIYFSERWLRYSQTETLYISSITLPRPSARVFLLQAVKLDKERNEQQTAKYTQALAVRQESDQYLETFEGALELDAENALFNIRFGCRLYEEGQYSKAFNQFQNAEALMQDNAPNALPSYLQAAAIAAHGSSRSSINDAMTIITKTNNRGKGLAFPKPFWFSGYPQTGVQYANLNRNIMLETRAPLKHLVNRIYREIASQINADQTNSIQLWIDHLSKMGSYIVTSSSSTGILHAIAGYEIMHMAALLNEKLEEKSTGTVSEKTLERRLRLEQIINTLDNFESERNGRIEREIQAIHLPLLTAVLSVIATTLLWTLAFFVYKLFRLRKTAWTIPHGNSAKIVLGGGCTFLFILLYWMTIMQGMADKPDEYFKIATTAWSLCLGGMMLFGLVYPAMTLVSPEQVSRKIGRPEELESILQFAKSAYRKVYASMAMRYYGILNGSVIFVICLWIILYRLNYELYPWQVNLLASASITDELNLIAEMENALSSSTL